MKKVIKLAFAIIACELAGIVGAVFTAPAIPGWYAGLAKPELLPPGWVFAPVWTALFALMGVSVFLVWEKGWERKEVRTALGVFAASLVLNVLWSVIFFGLRNPAGAFVEIIVLWVSILLAIFSFAKVSNLAARLMVPYLLWVSFAAYLTFAVWKLN